MKVFLLCSVILSLALSAAGQKRALPPAMQKRSSYFLTKNFDPFHINSLDSVCQEFNVRKRQITEGDYYCTFRSGMGVFTFSTFDMPVLYDTARFLDRMGSHQNFDQGDNVNLKGILVNSTDGKKMSKIYSQLLLSAYRQETDSEYLKNETNFTALTVKSTGRFWKRNFLNMGYGMAYATKDNPFISGKGTLIGSGYILEALHYIPIFGGPFFGATPADKIAIPIIGLTSLIIWKTIFYGLVFGQPTIKSYNRHVQRKYKIPISLIN